MRRHTGFPCRGFPRRKRDLGSGVPEATRDAARSQRTVNKHLVMEINRLAELPVNIRELFICGHARRPKPTGVNVSRGMLGISLIPKKPVLRVIVNNFNLCFNQDGALL